MNCLLVSHHVLSLSEVETVSFNTSDPRQSGEDGVVGPGRDIRDEREDEITGLLQWRAAESTNTRGGGSTAGSVVIANGDAEPAQTGRLQ